MEYASRVFALGNSNAIRLPRIVMEAMSLKTDDPITIEVVNSGELIIRKQKSAAYPSIRELFAGYAGGHPTEMDASGMVGRELI
ncbi:MAG: AbrB/MazE/SpoVT family DNA-binding domain-containing protein [Oscillospiraceae bacterium]|nr:AbrB/MazE/SpoVT family DNA-binding domain-containing protein [Oscillospiraceae bacterium]